MLIITSKASIIGTTYIAGSIKEKPKPLKPLIIEAINTTNTTK